MGYIPCVGTGKRPFRLPPRMICGEDWPWAPDIFGGVQPSMMFFENKPVGIYIIILYIYISLYYTNFIWFSKMSRNRASTGFQ
jgi:hypothetical protein